MRRLIFLMMLLLPLYAHAMDIYVAPILYVDETAGNRRDTLKVQTDLLSVLWSTETGMELRYDRLKDNRINPPASLSEAVIVCREEQIEYLLYGYVTKRAHSIHAEIRLFEYESRSVIHSFFGMDSSSHYDRLIEDMAEKILSYIVETFNLEEKPERVASTKLLIPLMVGYWTPLDKGWIEVMYGTVAAGTGFVFIPSDNLFIIRGLSFSLSTGLEAKYRYGIGNPAGYESSNHTLYLTVPLRLHMRLKQRHEIFTGLGYTYYLEFFSMADKYSDRESYLFNNMGLHTELGYRFDLGRIVSIFFRNDFDFLFTNHSLITYSPVIGLNMQVYNKEIKKRW